MRNKNDLWIEMAIREISTQAHFAEIAYYKLSSGEGTDTIFMSIFSFLAHCANVSKMLKSSNETKFRNDYPCRVIGKLLSYFSLNKHLVIGNILRVTNSSFIHKRAFRNHLEHYDDRLKDWIKKRNANINIGTYNVGPKPQIVVQNMVFVTHYDPGAHIFTFVDKDCDLEKLYLEIIRIKELADAWIKSKQSIVFK